MTTRMTTPPDPVCGTRAAPGPGAYEATGPLTITLPADPAFVAVVHAAVGAFADGVAGDGACTRDLQVATDEAASVVLATARPLSEVQLSFERDDLDVYVRLHAPWDDASEVAFDEVSRARVAGAVESFVLDTDGLSILAVLQRPRYRG